MKLLSENIYGNLHEAAQFCNNLGISDIVAMEYGGGNYTVIVYRVTEAQYQAHMLKRAERNKS